MRVCVSACVSVRVHERARVTPRPLMHVQHGVQEDIGDDCCHHHAPAELAEAREDKRLIAEAYTRVSTHEAEEKAEKAKAAAMKKLRKIEEEEDDVEPSDVARGKGKMRRLK